EAIDILHDFIKTELNSKEWYSKIKPHVKAIVFYGSSAKGTNRPDSDIDALIFVPLEIEKKYTEGEYSYEFQGHEVNIVLRSIERLRILGKEQNSMFEAEVFRESEILSESDSEVRELVEKIKKAKKS
ncbi:MAG: nucleotidyltransferase domain-containing protein, partial [Candidatus Woesearchaeota archaeon]